MVVVKVDPSPTANPLCLYSRVPVVGGICCACARIVALCSVQAILFNSSVFSFERMATLTQRLLEFLKRRCRKTSQSDIVISIAALEDIPQLCGSRKVSLPASFLEDTLLSPIGFVRANTLFRLCHISWQAMPDRYASSSFLLGRGRQSNMTCNPRLLAAHRLPRPRWKLLRSAMARLSHQQPLRLTSWLWPTQILIRAWTGRTFSKP